MGLASYDRYLQRLADTDSNLVGIGRIHLVCLPWFVAVLLVRPVFEVLGWGGLSGMIAGTAISVVLLIGLLWSGFKYVAYRTRRRNSEPRSPSEKADHL